MLGVLAVVFAESGLLIGCFLPGDSLLFTTGLLVADGRYLHQPLWLVCLLVSAAAVAGDQVGYLFGRRLGPALFRRPDARLFRREHLARAKEFFTRHGARSIVLARFVPVVRTFTPIVAGAAGMDYRTFVRYNVVGGVLWATGVTTLGHVLGQVPFVRSNIEFFLVGVVVLSLLPVAAGLLRARVPAGRRRVTGRRGPSR
ncbi:VTT domain-containing protein [Dactylosporangium sp. NBC_01737]|uniref:DedA family protein n=1 Tax=Dactylosporangium sp. NBC_01737 TaxID=2975959 RepID=UPI002E1057CE|nr:VTT domain-containing protein [Dactylosporangium sp. NBC_01737]